MGPQCGNEGLHVQGYLQGPSWPRGIIRNAGAICTGGTLCHHVVSQTRFSLDS